MCGCTLTPAWQLAAALHLFSQPWPRVQITRFRRRELYEILLSTYDMVVQSPPRHSSIAGVLPVLADMAKADQCEVSNFALHCVVVWLLESQVSCQWSSFASGALKGYAFSYVGLPELTYLGNAAAYKKQGKASNQPRATAENFQRTVDRRGAKEAMTSHL